MLNLNKKKFLITSTPIFLSLIIIISILILSKSLPPKLPLFYSLPWGEKQLATIQQLYILPTTMLILLLLNLALSWQLHSQQTFFKNVLLFSSILLSIILTITFIKIVLIFI